MVEFDRRQTIFIGETDNYRWQRAVILFCVLLLSIGGIWLYKLNADGAGKVVSWLTDVLLNHVTLPMFFFFGIGGGLILVPVPTELLFILGLNQGNNPFFGVPLIVAGVVIGHLITYWLGLRMSTNMHYLLSTKKIYYLRRKVNRYGGIAILVMNIIFAPSDLLTLGLGMMKYNRTRLVLLVFVGNAIKYTAIALVWHFIPTLIRG